MSEFLDELKAVWTRLQDYLFGSYSAGKDFYPGTDPKSLWLQEGTILPQYFVKHVDGTYSVADPKQTVGYAKESVDPVTKSKLAHLKFLLSQAPLIQGPTADHIRSSRSPFAYVHPKTLAAASAGACTIKHGAPFVQFPGSPTRWVSTTLMPEGNVIYTPNALPGLGNILRVK